FTRVFRARASTRSVTSCSLRYYIGSHSLSQKHVAIARNHRTLRANSLDVLRGWFSDVRMRAINYLVKIVKRFNHQKREKIRVTTRVLLLLLWYVRVSPTGQRRGLVIKRINHVRFSRLG